MTAEHAPKDDEDPFVWDISGLHPIPVGMIACPGCALWDSPGEEECSDKPSRRIPRLAVR